LYPNASYTFTPNNDDPFVAKLLGASSDSAFYPLHAFLFLERNGVQEEYNNGAFTTIKFKSLPKRPSYARDQ
jgi:hypothetical protein